MRQIAIFGKGGAGKTTIAVNLSAALAEAEYRVLLVGCSPTADSSYLILGESVPLTLRDYLATPDRFDPASLMATGYHGIACVEAGDFLHTNQCASRSIAEALQYLHASALLQEPSPDFVIYDIPGDISCNGAALLGDITIQTALLVASADFQSMFSANRFATLIGRTHPEARITLVANGNASSFEDSLVADYAKLIGLPLAAVIPRSLVVRHSDLYGKTVIEAAPLSTHAYAYRSLARKLLDYEPSGNGPGIATLSDVDLRTWARSWGERLGELEFGIIQDGAGI